MKEFNKIAALLFFALMLQSAGIFAQEPIKFSSVAKKSNVPFWEPVAVVAGGANILSGVEFYSKSAECDQVSSDLVKLINTNNYSVKIAFQIEKSGPVQYVRVPANATIEGVCNAADPNIAKLIFHLGAGDMARKAKEFIISSLVVSEFK